MFSIDRQSDPYETYILTDEAARSRLEVVPERGGIITRWQVQGQEILYLDQERFANPSLTVRGGVPILFPICGNLPDNQYTHNGQTYTLKQHGFARDLPWTVGDRTTEEGAAITLHLTSNDQTLAVYPFAFELAFTYRLQGNTLEIQQRFTNRAAEPMPFSSGLHPYFTVSDKAQLQFEIPATELQNQRDRTTHPFNGTFDLTQDEIDVAFKEVSAQSAHVTDPTRPLRLTLEYDTFYPILVFWTVKGKDFYCLEPWSAPRNALNTQEHLTLLLPGETREAIVKLTAELQILG